MISTKGKNALKAMIDLSEQNKNNYTPLKDIAKRQSISKKYLESIVKKLVDNKLLVGISGKNGGYKLSKSPSKYSIGEILDAVESPFFTLSCMSSDKNLCDHKNACKTYPIWKGLNEVIHNYLYKKKLSELI